MILINNRLSCRIPTVSESRTFFIPALCLCALVSLCQHLFLSPAIAAPLQPSDYFQFHVIDDQTHRGVPLVDLETTNNIHYVTDSNGVVALYEPGLMDQEVFFTITSHGYEFPKDGFGIHGTRFKITPGGKAEIKIKRLNIAERLYRQTGGGIYRESVLLGLPVPTKQPVLNGKVLGCDSVMTWLYHGKVFWLWGDTNWPAYPLGNFNSTGATSLLPKDGGLDPDKGVDFTYFVGKNGFVKGMAPVPGPGPTWPFAPIVLMDKGRERLLAGYSKIKDASMVTYERGLLEYNDKKEEFEKVATWKLDHPVQPGGHAFVGRCDGVDYVYYMTPIPLTRVRAEPDLLKDLDNFETFTCLKEGSTLKDPQLDRDGDGRLHYSWKHGTPLVWQKEQDELIKAGKMKPEEAMLQIKDPDTGKPILLHAGDVAWNAYRKKWIMIFCESMGTSVLGETRYAEANSPMGPWLYAKKIVTHDTYSFYNPRHHPFFDQQGGRMIYFEGTYTQTFSGAKVPTPRYDYNQVMYRLDLSDPRLRLPEATAAHEAFDRIEPIAQGTP